jgi:hypothetical protein
MIEQQPEPREIQAKDGDRFFINPTLEPVFEKGTETENEVTIVITSKPSEFMSRYLLNGRLSHR